MKMLGPMSLMLQLLPLAAGCDSYGGSDYKGDPLATFHGVVSGDRVTDEELVASLTHQEFRDEEGAWHSYAFVPIETEGEFPASFVLNVYEPPSDFYLKDVHDLYPLSPPDPDEPRFAGSQIFVIDPRFLECPENVDCQGPVARACESVYYFDRPVSAESRTGQLFGGEFTAGYHLLRQSGRSWMTEPNPTAEQLACYGQLVQSYTDRGIANVEVCAAHECDMVFERPIWEPELPFETTIVIEINSNSNPWDPVCFAGEFESTLPPTFTTPSGEVVTTTTPTPGLGARCTLDW